VIGIAPALIATLLVAQTPATQMLAGIALGTRATDVVSAHKGVSTGNRWGPTWTWNSAGIGTVRVTADDDGNVGIVDVVLAKSSSTIDLPGAASFPVNAGHEKYTDASSYVESDSCNPNATDGSCFAYTLDDGELVLQFDALGPLHEALWGDRALLKTLDLIQPGPSI
jgi:hypothetical protein